MDSLTSTGTFKVKRISLNLDASKTFVRLLAIIAALTLASTAAAGAMFFYRWPENSVEYEVVRLFWLDSESNIPTLYQVMALFAASALSYVIGLRTDARGGADVARWKLVAAVLLFVGVDEGVRIHELIDEAFNSHLWFIVYSAPLLALAVWLTPFLLRLRGGTRLLLIASGFTYVVGAVGLEVVGQLYADVHGKATIVYGLLATCEEVLEMLGIALLIYTLMDYLTTLNVQASKTVDGRTGVSSRLVAHRRSDRSVITT